MSISKEAERGISEVFKPFGKAAKRTALAVVEQEIDQRGKRRGFWHKVKNLKDFIKKSQGK